ncbi:MAG: ABC transporter ATP-binding protein [Treponema sp.]|nr:ABC transporter ATP-binding protein [Treponema sp.]
MIEVNNLYAGYGSVTAKGYIDVIRNISFRAGRGESLCVLGPNGCGKSTLLRSIARIIDCRGTITLDGQDAASFPRREMAKKIALLGQSVQVFFPYSVYDTVSMGRYAYSRGFLKNLSAEDTEIIENIIDKLDIAGIQDRMIDELSGGQLQRVFLARTLAQTPDVILLDEPTNHLDLKYQLELLAFLKSWVSENGKTLIGVFHDLNLARRFGDTAILMQNGEIAAAGTIEETLNSETLHAVYGIDIRGFMLESLERWRA